MDARQLDEILAATLDDERLSRGERQALGAVIAELGAEQLALVRSRAFALARERLTDRNGSDLLAWCESITQLIGHHESQRAAAAASVRNEAWFSPGDACPRRIIELIDGTARQLDVCVFTLTDDRIADAVLRALSRRVAVRLLTDDEKSQDLGSDVDRLARAGVAVRTDRSEKHMHHKFAVFDRRILLTGSYNWTRSADRDNEENFVVTDDPGLVRAFLAEFEKLWEGFAEG